MARDLWDVVERGVSVENTRQKDVKIESGVSVENTRQKNLKIKDMTGLHMLQMSVTDSLFLRIARATSSKQAWEILKEEFGETDEIVSTKASNLRTKFRGMTMEEEETFVDYTKKLMEVVNQLKFYGSDISDEEVIHKICCSLLSRFDGIVRSMCGGYMTLTNVVWCLRAWEFYTDEREKREFPHNHNKRRRQ